MRRTALLLTATISLSVPFAGVTPAHAEELAPPPASLPGPIDTTRLLAMIDWLIARVDGAPLSPEVAEPLRASLVTLRQQIASGDLPDRGELEAIAEQVRAALAELGVAPLPSLVDPSLPLPPSGPGELPAPGQIREWVLLAIDRATAMLEASELPADEVDQLLVELAALRADVEAGVDVHEEAAVVFGHLRELLMQAAPDMARPPALPDDPREAIAILERVAERVTASPLPDRVKEIVLDHLGQLVERIEQSDGSVADAVDEYRRARFEAVRARVSSAIDHLAQLADEVFALATEAATAAAGAANSTLDDLRAEVAIATTVADLRGLTETLLDVRAVLLPFLEPGA